MGSQEDNAARWSEAPLGLRQTMALAMLAGHGAIFVKGYDIIIEIVVGEWASRIAVICLCFGVISSFTALAFCHKPARRPEHFWSYRSMMLLSGALLLTSLGSAAYSAPIFANYRAVARAYPEAQAALIANALPPTKAVDGGVKSQLVN